jgi:hypothetical protein
LIPSPPILIPRQPSAQPPSVLTVSSEGPPHDRMKCPKKKCCATDMGDDAGRDDEDASILRYFDRLSLLRSVSLSLSMVQCMQSLLCVFKQQKLNDSEELVKFYALAKRLQNGVQLVTGHCGRRETGKGGKNAKGRQKLEERN